jgi:cell division protein FtsW (lipid II flippase)
MALSLIFITGFVFVSSVPDPGKLAVGFLTLLISLFITILSIGDYSFFNLLRLSSAISFLQNERILLIVISGILLFTTIFFFRKNCLIIILIFTLLGSACGFGYSFAWNNVLKDYQKDRINTFINPEEDPLGDGYQVNQSIIATGSGQIWGRGFGRGTQSNLNFLPERHTDFIFASYAEEFGFVGSILLVGLYVILLSRIISIGIRSQDGFGFLVCIGVAAMILFQFLVNVGMNIGIMPVTGVTLPLFSYGGSSLITTLMAIALVQSVSKGQDLINMNDSLVMRERV